MMSSFFHLHFLFIGIFAATNTFKTYKRPINFCLSLLVNRIMGCITYLCCPAGTSMPKRFLFRIREASPMPKWNRNNWPVTVWWLRPLDGPSVCCKELMDIFSCQMWQPVTSKQLMVSHKYNSVSAVASGRVLHRVHFNVKSCLPPATIRHSHRQAPTVIGQRALI